METPYLIPIQPPVIMGIPSAVNSATVISPSAVYTPVQPTVPPVVTDTFQAVQKPSVTGQKPIKKQPTVMLGVPLWLASLSGIGLFAVGVGVTGTWLRWGKAVKHPIPQVVAENHWQQAWEHLKSRLPWVEIQTNPATMAESVVQKITTLTQRQQELETLLVAQQGEQHTSQPLEETLANIEALKQRLAVPRHTKITPEPYQPPNLYRDKTPHQLPDTVPPIVTSTAPPLTMPTVAELNMMPVGTAKDFSIPAGEKGYMPKALKQGEVVTLNPNDERLGVKDTGVEATYADMWDIAKLTRDLLQNFSDAHRENSSGKATLAGVRVAVDKQQSDTWQLTIGGDAQYPIRYALNIGASTKADDVNATGGFGEGLKVAILALLGNKEAGVDAVLLACDNWEIRYYLQKDSDNILKLHSEVSLQNPPIKGNTLQLETKNPELLQAFLTARDYFYHPDNPHFQNITYENAYGGFKLLSSEKEKGNLYYVGQQQAVLNKNNQTVFEQSLQGIHLWTNQKDIEKHGKNPTGRDRSAFNIREIGELMIKPIVQQMKDEDLIHNIQAMEYFWDKSDGGKEVYDVLLDAILDEAHRRNLYIEFPNTVLANNTFNSEIAERLQKLGFRLCRWSFHHIGMNTSAEKLRELDALVGMQPTTTQTQKLNLLHEVAIQYARVAETLRQQGTQLPTEPADMDKCLPLFDPNALVKPVYVFDRTKFPYHQDTLGGATDTEIWMDISTFTNTFANALAIYLHELMHSHGNDASAVFSYKMTDLLALKEYIHANPAVLPLSLQQYQTLWDTI